MKDDMKYKEHEVKEMKGEMKKEHHHSEKGMEKPHMKKHGEKLIDVTMDGSGRSAYPRPKKLNNLCY